jgi:hypothetical protein
MCTRAIKHRPAARPDSRAILTAYVRSRACLSASLPLPPDRTPPSVGKVAVPLPSQHSRPPHPLLCATAHLSSVFPRRSPPSHACPSAAEAGRLSHPRLHRLDVASEDPTPCAVWSPHRLRAGVTPSCQRPPSTLVQSWLRAAGVTRGRTPCVSESSALAVAWAAFQRWPCVRGPCSSAVPLGRKRIRPIGL